jgi:hypothetical protein
VKRPRAAAFAVFVLVVVLSGALDRVYSTGSTNSVSSVDEIDAADHHGRQGPLHLGADARC